MHCMSDLYLAEELRLEYEEREQIGETVFTQFEKAFDGQHRQKIILS